MNDAAVAGSVESIVHSEGPQSPDNLSVLEDRKATRVALLFFGVNRSLNYTLSSIQENVLHPLEEAGYQPTVFLHTYSEGSVAVDIKPNETESYEWELLEPFMSSVTNQTLFLEKHRQVSSPCRYVLMWSFGYYLFEQKNSNRILLMICMLMICCCFSLTAPDRLLRGIHSYSISADQTSGNIDTMASHAGITYPSV